MPVTSTQPGAMFRGTDVGDTLGRRAAAEVATKLRAKLEDHCAAALATAVHLQDYVVVTQVDDRVTVYEPLVVVTVFRPTAAGVICHDEIHMIHAVVAQLRLWSKCTISLEIC